METQCRFHHEMRNVQLVCASVDSARAICARPGTGGSTIGGFHRPPPAPHRLDVLGSRLLRRERGLDIARPTVAVVQGSRRQSGSSARTHPGCAAICRRAAGRCRGRGRAAQGVDGVLGPAVMRHRRGFRANQQAPRTGSDWPAGALDLRGLPLAAAEQPQANRPTEVSGHEHRPEHAGLLRAQVQRETITPAGWDQPEEHHVDPGRRRGVAGAVEGLHADHIHQPYTNSE